MKKTLIILIAIILTFSSVNTAFAETEDLFYYDYTTDEALMTSLEEDKEFMQEFDIEYLEKFYLPEGKSADINKMTYDLSKIRRYYLWHREDVLNFMKAKDKAKFLNENMEISHVTFPCYYDGVKLDDYYEIYTRREFDYYTESDLPPSKKITYEPLSIGRPNSKHYIDISFVDKQQLIDSLEKDGFIEYDIIYPVNFCGMDFTIAEKDGETFAIFMEESFKNFLSDDLINKNEWDLRKQLYNNNIEQFKSRVFTIFQMEQLSNEYENLLSKRPETEDNYAGRTTETNSFPWEWIILGGALVVVTALTTVFVVIKKRKIK